jgi:hypothetical protein
MYLRRQAEERSGGGGRRGPLAGSESLAPTHNQKSHIVRLHFGLLPFLFQGSLSFSYPFPNKWGPYNMFSSCCDKNSAIVFTNGRRPDVNPPWQSLFQGD